MAKYTNSLLLADYDSRASFYGKARVVDDGERTILLSYDTEVAYIEHGQAYVESTYSHTTLRHIKEFLLQHGFKAENKHQILRDYV